MRNGVPTGPVTASTAGQSTTGAAASANSEAAAPATAGAAVPSPSTPPEFKPQPKVAWSQRLPGLQEGQVGVEAVPVALPALQTGAPAHPPPEPEAALARWAGERGSAVPETRPPASVAPQSPATAAARAQATTGPYTVQIGAFRSVGHARAYIDRHGLGDLALEVQPVDRGGREYQVVTFGSFATAGEATEAWRRIAAGRELDFWVRPVR